MLRDGVDPDPESRSGNGKRDGGVGGGMEEARVERQEVEVAVGGTLHLETAFVGDDPALGLPIGAEGDIPLVAEL